MSDHDDILNTLYVPFERIHILVNRTQCATSVYAADVQPYPEGPRYYQETITINGYVLRLFDLQSYLCETFNAQTDVPAQLALIIPLDRVSRPTREALRSGPMAEVDQDQLAMRVSSETAMKTVKLNQLRPLGETMRVYLARRGLIAVHPDERSFGFLVDLDQMLSLSLGVPL